MVCTVWRSPRTWPAAAVAPALLLAGPAHAHVAHHHGAAPWAAWNLTPDIALGTLLLAGLYGAGLWRRRHKTDRVRAWRHVSFLAGLAAVFLALQSPIDSVSERVFAIHQVQHLLIRMVGPMLLMLAAPQGLLVAGMPDAVRRRVLMPILANPVLRGVFGALAQPAVATALFIGALYVWQIPSYHELALRNDRVHYLMHVTLLFTGLVFFWRVFDTRPDPVGTRYGARLVMLWFAVLSNILIGAYLTLKRVILYPAYGEMGRPWNLSALTDEEIGAATIWIPGSMMAIVALVIVIHMWGRHETRVERRRSGALPGQAHGHGAPMGTPVVTPAERARRRAPRNRAMALGFAAFAIGVLATAIGIGVVSRIMGR